MSLSEIFDKYFRGFNIKDITMIAIQILERIKSIHSKNIIHHNINPDNLYIDFSKFQNVIYLNNFIQQNNPSEIRDCILGLRPQINAPNKT